jgi:GH24 family phage-related lysozyme (muramidase)
MSVVYGITQFYIYLDIGATGCGWHTPSCPSWQPGERRETTEKEEEERTENKKREKEEEERRGIKIKIKEYERIKKNNEDKSW